jgi:uncharacterized protein YhaN
VSGAIQGAVLQRASELFSRLTLGEHSGLTAFGENDRQVLVAVRKNKEHVEVKGLSDGTLDQLYLSLRLAAIEDHVIRVTPCPVILDDTLITAMIFALLRHSKSSLSFRSKHRCSCSRIIGTWQN